MRADGELTFASGVCEIKNHLKSRSAVFPTLPPFSQSWKQNCGDPVFAQMVLYFTGVCIQENTLPTLTERGKGLEIPRTDFRNGSLFHKHRNPENAKMDPQEC